MREWHSFSCFFLLQLLNRFSSCDLKKKYHHTYVMSLSQNRHMALLADRPTLNLHPQNPSESATDFHRIRTSIIPLPVDLLNVFGLFNYAFSYQLECSSWLHLTYFTIFKSIPQIFPQSVQKKKKKPSCIFCGLAY